MKKKDLALISETYANLVLNENVPPYELGGSYENPDPKKYQVDNTTYPGGPWKALQGNYSGARDFKFHPDYEKILTAIINKMGREIVAIITANEGRIEDNPEEMYTRVGKMITNSITANGKPLFAPSHAFHVARNVVEALIRAGVVKDIPGPRKGGRGSGPRAGATATDFDFDFD